MKNINNVLSLIFVTIAVFPCILAYYLFVEQSTDYYTKIDNRIKLVLWNICIVIDVKTVSVF